MTAPSKFIPGVANIVPDFISRPAQTDSHFFLLSVDQELALLPAKSRALSCSAVKSLLQLKSGVTRDPKELGTIFSRRVHYLGFCLDMKFVNNFLLVNVSQERCVLQFSIYALHLAWGESIYSCPIKAATVDAYLRSAATLVLNASGHDPRFTRLGDLQTMSPRIHSVLKEMKQVEKIPDRMNPYTTGMHETLLNIIDKDNAPADGFLCASKNWNACNLAMGCRLQEYAQTNAHRELHNAARDNFGDCKAFRLADIVLYDAEMRKVSFSYFIAHPDSVQFIDMTWSWQKNGQHGESLCYSRNHSSPDYDFIHNMHEIICRFDRLVGINDIHTPLGVFNEGGCTLFLHERKITQLMKPLAIRTFNLDPHTDTIKYGSHSMGVGACVALHSAGATETQIKFLLRWRSNSFMNYLRKIARLLQVQNDAISLAASTLSNA